MKWPLFCALMLTAALAVAKGNGPVLEFCLACGMYALTIDDDFERRSP